MKFIDFLSGIGGFRRGMELAGHECVGFCESVKAVKYADEWEPYDYENLYFTREEAEAALERKRGEKCW